MCLHPAFRQNVVLASLCSLLYLSSCSLLSCTQFKYFAITYGSDVLFLFRVSSCCRDPVLLTGSSELKHQPGCYTVSHLVCLKQHGYSPANIVPQSHLLNAFRLTLEVPHDTARSVVSVSSYTCGLRTRSVHISKMKEWFPLLLRSSQTTASYADSCAGFAVSPSTLGIQGWPEDEFTFIQQDCWRLYSVPPGN